MGWRKWELIEFGSVNAASSPQAYRPEGKRSPLWLPARRVYSSESPEATFRYLSSGLRPLTLDL